MNESDPVNEPESAPASASAPPSLPAAPTLAQLLRTLARWRRARIAAAVSLLLGVGLVLVPQFNVLGFEAAFAAAVVIPLAAGVVAAGLRRAGLSLVCPWAVLGALVVAAEVLVAIPLLVVIADMIAAPICDPLEGLLFFLLLPAFSAALAAVVGWFLALSVRTSGLATILWAFVWLASVALVLYRFFATPAVSFLGPFFGLYPGVLYDTLIPVSGKLLTYRATNLLEAGLLLVVAAFAWDPAASRFSLPRLIRARRAPYVVVPLLGLCAAAWVYGPNLGHRADTRAIGIRLGPPMRGTACDVYAPAETSDADLRLFVRDCDFRVDQIRRLVGLEAGARITVLLFRSEQEKAELMGAGRTSIAKPWRHEVYVQGPAFPHPVLKHELAHVLLGELCSGPFRVPATWGGFLPLPGLIEGGAVAVDWPVDELTPHGWAAAMDRLELLPAADTLLGVGFLGENAGLAYTATGSFVRWLLESRGPAAFRRVFPGGDFQQAYGRTLEALWSEWREWLTTIPLTAAQLEVARARFDAPGFFEIRCPHTVAKVAARRDELLAEGDVAGALAAQDEACQLSGDDPRQRIGRLALDVVAGRAGEAERLAAALLADGSIRGRPRDLVDMLRADAAWLAGRGAEAGTTYARLLPRAASSAERRLLLVKRYAVDHPTVEPFLRDYLLGVTLPGRPSAEPERRARERLAQGASAVPGDAVVQYLLARARVNSAQLEEAEALLRLSLGLGLPFPELQLEAHSLLAVLAWRRDDFAATEREANTLAASESPEYLAEGQDWLERIRYAASGASHAAKMRTSSSSAPSRK